MVGIFRQFIDGRKSYYFIFCLLEAKYLTCSKTILKPSLGLGMMKCVDWGAVAEWSRRGLQNLVHRFNSGPRLQIF